MARLEAVLFDVDGTLLDTRDAWIASFDAGLAAVRRPVMPGSDGARWIGTPIEMIYAERRGLRGDELRRAVEVFQRVEAKSIRHGVRPFPGIREMLAALPPWRLGAITNKRQDTTVASLRLAGFGDGFSIVLGGDSVPRKKPAPDPVLQAALALGLSPEACVVVGDTEVDVRAGRDAGAVTVGVTWGYGTRVRLEEAGVRFLVEAPAALPPLLRTLTPSTGI